MTKQMLEEIQPQMFIGHLCSSLSIIRSFSCHYYCICYGDQEIMIFAIIVGSTINCAHAKWQILLINITCYNYSIGLHFTPTCGSSHLLTRKNIAVNPAATSKGPRERKNHMPLTLSQRLLWMMKLSEEGVSWSEVTWPLLTQSISEADWLLSSRSQLGWV